jgi:hypothetical protein
MIDPCGQRANIIIDFMKDYKPGEALTGVEIGVFFGDFLCRLLDMEPRVSKMYGIDPYSIDCGYRKGWTQDNWDEIYLKAMTRFQPYGDRISIIRAKSELCGNIIPMVDFVEIDGLHTYHQVRHEIRYYEKKVKPGGMLCGHDYFGKFYRHVRKAVDEYARRHNRDLKTGLEISGMWWWRVP